MGRALLRLRVCHDQVCLLNVSPSFRLVFHQTPLIELALRAFILFFPHPHVFFRPIAPQDLLGFTPHSSDSCRPPHTMNDEFKIDPTFKAWGPFIPDTYENEPITTSDIIIAGTIFALTLANALLAMYLGFYQTIGSRSPIRSTYVWMIWLELLVSFLMGLECFLHLLKFIKPSKSSILLLSPSRLTFANRCIGFAFYFTIRKQPRILQATRFSGHDSCFAWS